MKETRIGFKKNVVSCDDAQSVGISIFSFYNALLSSLHKISFMIITGAYFQPLRKACLLRPIKNKERTTLKFQRAMAENLKND